MNIPKVSVIVLIYKVEKYIERCARSLFCQTMQDIEYIFVNDCTLGRCVKMHTFCFLRTKPRLSQAGALLLPKDFVSLGIRISL